MAVLLLSNMDQTLAHWQKPTSSVSKMNSRAPSDERTPAMRLQALAELSVSHRAEQPQDQEDDEDQSKYSANPTITPAAITKATAA